MEFENSQDELSYEEYGEDLTEADDINETTTKIDNTQNDSLHLLEEENCIDDDEGDFGSEVNEIIEKTEIAEPGETVKENRADKEKWSSARVLMVRDDYMKDHKFDEEALNLPSITYINTSLRNPFGSFINGIFIKGNFEDDQSEDIAVKDVHATQAMECDIDNFDEKVLIEDDENLDEKLKLLEDYTIIHGKLVNLTKDKRGFDLDDLFNKYMERVLVDMEILNDYDLLILSPFDFIMEYFTPDKMMYEVDNPDEHLKKAKVIFKAYKKKLRKIFFILIDWHKKLTERFPQLRITYLLPYPLNYDKIEKDIGIKEGRDIKKLNTYFSLIQFSAIMAIDKMWLENDDMRKVPFVTLSDLVVMKGSFIDGLESLKWKEEITSDQLGMGFSSNLDAKMWKAIMYSYVKVMPAVFALNNKRWQLIYGKQLWQFDRTKIENQIGEFSCHNRKLLAQAGINSYIYDYTFEYFHHKKIQRNTEQKKRNLLKNNDKNSPGQGRNGAHGRLGLNSNMVNQTYGQQQYMRQGWGVDDQRLPRLNEIVTGKFHRTNRGRGRGSERMDTLDTPYGKRKREPYQSGEGNYYDNESRSYGSKPYNNHLGSQMATASRQPGYSRGNHFMDPNVGFINDRNDFVGPNRGPFGTNCNSFSNRIEFNDPSPNPAMGGRINRYINNGAQFGGPSQSSIQMMGNLNRTNSSPFERYNANPPQGSLNSGFSTLGKGYGASNNSGNSGSQNSYVQNNSYSNTSTFNTETRSNYSPLHALNIICECSEVLGSFAKDICALKLQATMMESEGSNPMELFRENDSIVLIRLCEGKLEDAASGMSGFDQLVVQSAMKACHGLLCELKTYFG